MNAGGGAITPGTEAAIAAVQPKRFYGTVTLNSSRLGRDAGRIAEEILSHLVSFPGANSEVTLDIEVRIPDGVPNNIVRTVNENCRTLKFTSQGFETE